MGKMEDATISTYDDDIAALQQADDYIRRVVVHQNGWALISQSEVRSPIRGRYARRAVVQNGEFMCTIVWDRGLQRFLTPTDLEGERWAIFDPASMV